MAYGILGKRVRLVPLEAKKHFENCLRWINSTEVTDTLGIGGLPMNEAKEIKWFEGLAHSETNTVFAIELLDGTHIGNTGLHGIDWVNGIANTGSYIGDLSHRGLGYGSEAVILRARFAFDRLNLRMLYAGYLEGNEASARMQAKCGYKVWGSCPKRFHRRGQYIDLVSTVLSREDFYALHGH